MVRRLVWRRTTSCVLSVRYMSRASVPNRRCVARHGPCRKLLRRRVLLHPLADGHGRTDECCNTARGPRPELQSYALGYVTWLDMPKLSPSSIFSLPLPRHRRVGLPRCLRLWWRWRATCVSLSWDVLVDLPRLAGAGLRPRRRGQCPRPARSVRLCPTPLLRTVCIDRTFYAPCRQPTMRPMPRPSRTIFALS